MNSLVGWRSHPRSVWSAGLCAAALSTVPVGLAAAAPDLSEVSGVHRLALTAGPNLISAPLHRAASFRGTVSGVAAGTLTFGTSPGWTANQFGPRDARYQFVALLRTDISIDPGHQGEWWPVTANTANALSLDTGGEDLTTLVGAGDAIEVRQLTSLKDLFGTGASLRLNKDVDGSASARDEDVLYLLTQTSFSSEIFYHNGALAPQGYYVDGEGPYDGSTLTLNPDQPIMVVRKAGSALLNLLFAGRVQSTRLTHYLSPGANPVGTAFPVDVAIGQCGLLEAGWLADANGSPSPAEEDVLYTVLGTSFADEAFYHDGSLASPGWYVNGEADEGFSLSSARGLVIYVKSPTGLRWSQPAPF